MFLILGDLARFVGAAGSVGHLRQNEAAYVDHPGGVHVLVQQGQPWRTPLADQHRTIVFKIQPVVSLAVGSHSRACTGLIAELEQV
jgi:hypothetical protein